MVRIGIVGCGRILNAHLQGYKQLRELGIDNFRITALCARREADALMFRRRGAGPPPRPPVLDPSTGDPLAAPHTYLSDFQDDVEAAVYTDYRELIASGEVDAINDFTTLALHHQGGRVVERVRADVDDTYLATLFFERGALGQLWWSWALHGEPLDIPGAPALMGSRGSLRGGEIQLEDGRRLPLQEEFERALSDADRARFFPRGLRDPYAIQQLDWLQAIERGDDPETSGEEGLRDLACAFAIIESSALGRQVTLEELLDGRVDGYQREIDQHYGLV